jgi:hypothetical protein
MVGHGRKRKKGIGEKEILWEVDLCPDLPKRRWLGKLAEERKVHEACGQWRRRAKIDIREKFGI